MPTRGFEPRTCDSTLPHSGPERLEADRFIAGRVRSDRSRQREAEPEPNGVRATWPARRSASLQALSARDASAPVAHSDQRTERE